MSHSEHFESLERQASAARLGMWVFIASEVLFFAALLSLYGSYRAQWPDAFRTAVAHNHMVLGTVNTLILLTASLTVALSVGESRAALTQRGYLLLCSSLGLSVLFLIVKGYEYHLHFEEGILPGSRGHYFETASPENQGVFFNLYYLLTGLHALHVAVGALLLGWAAFRLRPRSRRPIRSHQLEVVALYFHFVDAVWLFLWPLLYLTRGGVS